MSIGREINSSYIKNTPIISLTSNNLDLPRWIDKIDLKKLLSLPKIDIEKLLAENDAFIHRYNQILSQTVVEPGYSLKIYMPSSNNLILAQKLQWLYWSNKIEHGADLELISENINLQFTQLKQQICKTESLGKKMLFNRLLKQHLILHSQLLNIHNLPSTKYFPLTTKERSLHLAMQNQLYSLQQLIYDIKAGVDDNISEKNSSHLENTVSKILLKPNIMLNHGQIFYGKISSLSEKTSEQIIKTDRNSLSMKALPIWVKFYDPLSYTASTADWGNYQLEMLRLLQTNCLIDSFNHTNGKSLNTPTDPNCSLIEKMLPRYEQIN